MIGDGGYQGTGPITPYKKPPGGELTAKQKAYNHSVNRLRAAVERAISHLKNWKLQCRCAAPGTVENFVQRVGLDDVAGSWCGGVRVEA